ncbi:MAG: DNA ligase D [Clostridia bacterium]
MGLQRYREMRDFRITPEPRGAFSRSRKASPAKGAGLRLRYYIQRHHATRLHYDFRLELEGTLKSWAVPKGPSLDPSLRRLAMQTEDHPLEYGEFEGTIPEKQYGAGEVLLWDQGEWIPEDEDPAAALRKGRLHFELRGEKLRGSWVLTKTNSSEDRSAWLLIKRDDEEARHGEEDITVERPESVKRAPPAEKRARKIRRRSAQTWVPEFVAPQLATLVTEPPASSKAGGDWLFEIKYDGYRMLAQCRGRSVRLFTRTGKDWTARLPHLAKALQALELEDSLLDGEIAVPDERGRTDFQALQNAFDAGSDSRVVYYLFDAPYLHGEDLRALALRERKKRLKKVLDEAKSDTLRFSEDLSGDAAQVLQHACALGLEGLIGKQAGSVYASGRSKSWIKLKCRKRQDFVIGGYTAPGGSRHGFGALLVGYYDTQGKLRFAGKVGTGFDDEMLSSLLKRMVKIKKAESPFANPPREKGVTWLKPQLVAEVAYAERTKEGILRQAAFMGLREDMPAKGVGEEKAVTLDEQGDSKLPSAIKLTHPDRKVWPSLGITKRDLFEYYAAVGEHFLPHVKNRPLTLVRCPDGAEGKCFYQRHSLMGASPGQLKEVRRAGSKRGAYIYVDTLEAALSAVQNGAVEFHTWGASVPDIAHPDRIVMDLDPGPGVSWSELADAARLTKRLFDGLGLESFLKTTGGKGLHVVVPIVPELPWDEVKELTRRIAETMRRARPERFIATISKAERPGKIFVDYLRNSQTASAVAAYSARARPGAYVSMPLSWSELKSADLRTKFTLESVVARLGRQKTDPWAGYWSTRQKLTRKMMDALGV